MHRRHLYSFVKSYVLLNPVAQSQQLWNWSVMEQTCTLMMPSLCCYRRWLITASWLCSTRDDSCRIVFSILPPQFTSLVDPLPSFSCLVACFWLSMVKKLFLWLYLMNLAFFPVWPSSFCQTLESIGLVASFPKVRLQHSCWFVWVFSISCFWLIF